MSNTTANHSSSIDVSADPPSVRLPQAAVSLSHPNVVADGQLQNSVPSAIIVSAPATSARILTSDCGATIKPTTTGVPKVLNDYTEVRLNDGRSQVDFVLVYTKDDSEHLRKQRQFFEMNLLDEGLVLELDVEEANRLCFLKIHAPWTTLSRRAEMLQMKMPIRHGYCYNATSEQNGGRYLPSMFHLSDQENVLIGHQTVYVTAPFTRSRVEKFRVDDKHTFFSPTQRIRIVYDILNRTKCDPDKRMKHGIQWLLKSGAYKNAYPPHDGPVDWQHLNEGEPGQWCQRQVLKHTWANFARTFKPQPLHLIRAYFGEKVAFYFAWLGFYTQMLIFPSVAGLVCFLYGIFDLPNNRVLCEICDGDRAPGNLTMCPVCLLPNCVPWVMSTSCDSAKWNYTFDGPGTFIMTIVTLLWAFVFVELWKRKEASLAYSWDAYDLEQNEESTRPEYEEKAQKVRVSPFTQDPEFYICPWKRLLWLSESLAGLFFLILVVVLALLGLSAMRIVIYGLLKNLGGFWLQHQFEVTSMLIHLLTFAVLMTLGVIYERAAHWLTEYECPATQTDYLNRYVWKVFIFELLNNFVPIFYAALIRGRNFVQPSEQNHLKEFCDPGGCLNEPVQAIAILLLARLLISNAAELGYPLLKSIVKGTVRFRSPYATRLSSFSCRLSFFKSRHTHTTLSPDHRPLHSSLQLR